MIRRGFVLDECFKSRGIHGAGVVSTAETLSKRQISAQDRCMRIKLTLISMSLLMSECTKEETAASLSDAQLGPWKQEV
jgi:hypothetical protein